MNANWSWTVDPNSFITTVNQSVDDKTEELAQEIFDSVVALSPVRTGTFRASWNASKGSPVFKYNVGGTEQNPQQPPSWPKIKVKNREPIYITNGAPYAGRLEQGWSGQAPNGIVAVTLASL